MLRWKSCGTAECFVVVRKQNSDDSQASPPYPIPEFLVLSYAPDLRWFDTLRDNCARLAVIGIKVISEQKKT